MMSLNMRRLGAIAAVAGLALAAGSQPARAWWRGGVWVGVGGPLVVAPPPVVYAPPPPPAYYPYYPPYAYAPPPPPPPADQPAPPPPANAQAQQQPVAYAAMCYAGVYTCPAAPYTPVGSTCACDGLGAPSYGTAQ